MARIGLIIFSLVLLFGSSVALISEAVVASLLLLNTLLGTSNVEVAVAAAIGEASSLAHKAGVVSPGYPSSGWHVGIAPPPLPFFEGAPFPENGLDAGNLGGSPCNPAGNIPAFDTPALDNAPAVGVPDLAAPAVETSTIAALSRRRRRRQAVENDAKNDGWKLPNRSKLLPLLSPELANSVPVNDKTLQDLQDEIFDNMHVIAHDMASELSLLLGLPPHAVEAVVTHEEDAPSFPRVLETVAKRFHAPKLLLAGLHSLIERTDYFEDNYELDDDFDSPDSPAHF